MIALVAACLAPGLLFSALGGTGFVLARRYIADAEGTPRWARVVAIGAATLLCLHGLWLSIAGVTYLLAVAG